jgi:hypothetical protein
MSHAANDIWYEQIKERKDARKAAKDQPKVVHHKWWFDDTCPHCSASPMTASCNNAGCTDLPYRGLKI